MTVKLVTHARLVIVVFSFI